MSSLPDFEGWAVFARVATLGSFAKAADSLDMTQPTVSKAIARLEKRLGTALLYRTSRRLSLTPTGAAVYERALGILHEGETIEGEVSQQVLTPRGTVRLAAPTAFGRTFLPPLLPEFIERYPEINVVVSLSSTTIDIVADGYDVALEIDRLPDSSPRSQWLCTLTRLLVAAPDYLRRHGHPQRPEELKQHACLVHTNLTGPEQWTFNHAVEGERHVSVAPRISSDNVDAIVPALISGKGVSLLPAFVVADPLQRGELEMILSDWTVPSLYVNLVTRLGTLRPPKIRALVEYLDAHLADRPGDTRQKYSVTEFRSASR